MINIIYKWKKSVDYKIQFRINRSLDKPKSVSFICPMEVMSKLSGFKSRCTMPYEWRYSRASTTSAVYILAISKGKVQIFFSNVRTSPPFISFIKKLAGKRLKTSNEVQNRPSKCTSDFYRLFQTYPSTNSMIIQRWVCVSNAQYIETTKGFSVKVIISLSRNALWTWFRSWRELLVILFIAKRFRLSRWRTKYTFASEK